MLLLNLFQIVHCLMLGTAYVVTCVFLTILFEPLEENGHSCLADLWECVQDCGRYKNVTTIFVNLSTFITAKIDGWDVSKAQPIKLMANAGFKWNIYSQYVPLCVCYLEPTTDVEITLMSEFHQK